jgi:hypothetical protein
MQKIQTNCFSSFIILFNQFSKLKDSGFLAMWILDYASYLAGEKPLLPKRFFHLGPII